MKKLYVIGYKKMYNKNVYSMLLASVFTFCSITHAQADDCSRLRAIVDANKGSNLSTKREGVGSVRGQITGLFAGISAAMGCYDNDVLKLAWDEIQHIEFSIKKPNSKTKMFINSSKDSQGYHNFEGWSDTAQNSTAGFTRKFKMWKPEQVYLSDSYYAKTLYRIAAVGGDRGSDCLNLGEVEVYGGLCEVVQFMGVKIYPTLWDIETVEGSDGVRFIAYKPDGYEADWHGNTYPVYHRVGAMGYAPKSHNYNAAYHGFADVLPTNTRIWDVINP